MSSEVMFDETKIRTVSQVKFLANPKSKDRLISILMNKFFSVNMACKKAYEYSDCLIVKALTLAGPRWPSDKASTSGPEGRRFKTRFH
ncbi:hypothetical protein AVEN_166536-1 [Araneus ventricosus]|uniref:Uncharacterized protein n=1 Tax=Araneus ventricosus TaxID=182803 RepID=A0A4Y2HDR5_ARAVE|nr:hypothetical protein AVEN_166536-1 [Araneus ventricosus]